MAKNFLIRNGKELFNQKWGGIFELEMAKNFLIGNGREFFIRNGREFFNSKLK